jgi:uncharacterized protein YerC
MTKISRIPMDPDKMGYLINDLWSAMTLMDSKQSVRLLFKDLFSHTEVKMFAKRLAVARRLLEGESYVVITRELNVTDPTIAHMSNILAEKGGGLRAAHFGLSKIEQGKRDREYGYEKQISEPFRDKMPGQDVLPKAIEWGIEKSVKAITKRRKKSSAKKKLNT